MKQNLTAITVKCPACGVFYLPNEDVCNCIEEPKVNNWEDVQNPELLSKWATGEVTL